jgi:hypothetical protein
MVPEIRYPLPTLVALLLLGFLAWRGEPLTRPLRGAIERQWRRVVEGPPVPSSPDPQRVVDSWTRRGLLLRDGIDATDVPGGSTVETIGHRMFVDIYDVWPLRGTPTHYRVGNRRPMGWVPAADILDWSTRLVVQPSGAAGSVPVVGWTESALEVAFWVPGREWQEIDRRTSIRLADVPPERWGVWLSRDELLVFLRRALAATDPRARATARLQAVFGRFAADRVVSSESEAQAKAWLPAMLWKAQPTTQEASDCLARINEHWTAETSWSGMSFQTIPLTCLP